MEKRRLSFSQIATFEQCPLRYKYHYIEKEVYKKYRRDRPYHSFGQAIHGALRDFFRIPPRERSLSLLHKLLRKKWIRKGFKDEEEERMWGNKALEILETFYKAHDIFAQPIMTERYFEVEEDSFILFGRVDRVDKLPDGFELIDYKTGKNAMTEAQMQNDLQLTFYYIGLKYGCNLNLKKLTYYFLQQNIVLSVECKEDEMEKGFKRIKEIAQRINEEKNFFPVLNEYCPACDYNIICPEKCNIPINLTDEELPFEEEGWQEDVQYVEKDL